MVYMRGGESAGPEDSDGIVALYHRRQISAETPVWRLGMPTWRALGETFPKINETPPPLSTGDSAVHGPWAPGLAAAATAASQVGEAPARQAAKAPEWTDTSAHPWRRYFARMF